MPYVKGSVSCDHGASPTIHDGGRAKAVLVRACSGGLWRGLLLAALDAGYGLTPEGALDQTGPIRPGIFSFFFSINLKPAQIRKSV
jgi:hypothetical protein